MDAATAAVITATSSRSSIGSGTRCPVLVQARAGAGLGSCRPGGFLLLLCAARFSALLIKRKQTDNKGNKDQNNKYDPHAENRV